MRVVAPFAVSDAISYRIVEVTSDGIFQKSIQSAGDNVEAQSVVENSKLRGITAKLENEGHANLVKLNKYLEANKIEFPTATSSVYPVKKLNDNPDSNVYMM